MRLIRPASILLAVALLGACGGDNTASQTAAHGEMDEALPAPAGTRGSVTGMPDQPGPGQVGPPPSEVLPDVALDAEGNPIPLPEDGVTPPDGSEAIAGESADGTTGEPTPDDAVAVVRDYYTAINGGSFARAYALWSDGGRASGQSPQQFADGFVDTTGVSVEIMAPGRIDAAAGSRVIEVPVALTATQRDGSERKYVGVYTLRRAVVEGATPEQGAWRIASADLREVQP